MTGYLVVIACAILGISTGVTLSGAMAFRTSLGYTLLAVLIAIAINGLTASICRLLPAKFADCNLKMYRVSLKEKKFYEKLKIRSWKDKIPELGHLTGFRKNKIPDPKSLECIDRFLLEVCYGQLGHFTSMLTSFLLLLFFPAKKIWLAFAVPVAIIAALMNLPSFLIQRYNWYKLQVLRKSIVKRQSRLQATEELAAEMGTASAETSFQEPVEVGQSR